MIYLLLGSKTFFIKKEKKKKKRERKVCPIIIMIAVELLGHESQVCKSPWYICFGIGTLVLSTV